MKIGLIVSGFAISVALVLLRPDSLSPTHAALAIAIICIGLAPSFIYLHQPTTAQSLFPLMPLTGMFYAIFFGLPAFLADYLIVPGGHKIQFYGRSFLDSISLEAQVLVLSGVAIMFLTWAFGKKVIFKSLPRFSLSSSDNNRTLIMLAWGLSIANLAYWLSPGIQALPSVGQFLQPAGFVAFAVFYLYNADGQLARADKYLYFLLALPIWIGSLLATGFLTAVLLLLTLWLVLRYTVIRALPWKTMLVIPFLFLLVYPHVAEYRAVYWQAESQSSAFTKLKGFAEIVGRRTLSEGFGTTNDARPFTRLVRRISLILPMSHVVESTPERTAYWAGATYRTLFSGWIPRFIWRDKPEERWGNEFGRRYEILAAENRSMSVNIPWITEMYANFGRTGVLLGMAFAGLFLGLFDRFLNSPQPKLLEKAVGAAVLLPLFNQESNFTLMTGSLIPLIVCLWLYFTIGLRLKSFWPFQPKS